ncbi:hypothetical protein D5086_016659 [Populus alba]|uniref:Uncharacterized protein n=1 Tax=Populus alba TaxID=43335 RepID=A0ACC4BUS9_POPAL
MACSYLCTCSLLICSLLAFLVSGDGKTVHLSLDERTGSGFASQDLYLHGYFSASIKLPADYTAGVVVAFYMSNGDIFEKNHDEIDFEFLGNIRGKDWRIQTNIYGNGSTSVGREERYSLWFDPSDDFHQYSILWTDSQITVLKALHYHLTINDLMVYMFPKCDNTESSEAIPTGVTTVQRIKMESFRAKFMTYSYCYDRVRYKVPPSECVINPKEADRLKSFDPVTFGGGRRHHGKRHHRSRAGHVEAISI